MNHGLRTPSEEIAFTAQPKIYSHSQIFRYGRSIFCLPHRPKFSDFFELCLHWVSVVRVRSFLISFIFIIIFSLPFVWSETKIVLSRVSFFFLIPWLFTELLQQQAVNYTALCSVCSISREKLSKWHDASGNGNIRHEDYFCWFSSWNRIVA